MHIKYYNNYLFLKDWITEFIMNNVENITVLRLRLCIKYILFNVYINIKQYKNNVKIYIFI